MKKLLSLTLAAAMLGLTACGGASASSAVSTAESVPTELPAAQSEEPAESAAETPAPTEAPAEAEAETPAEDTDGKVLVAYFSWSGNTEALANEIAGQLGADLFAIEPETPYTDDYNTLLDVAQQEQRDNARPALAATVENWDEYDTVFVGYPNWWSDAPMVVLSFLESYDCSGKTIVPFCTNGGGGFGNSLNSIAASAAGANIAEGFQINGNRAANAAGDVTAWLAELGLAQ